MAASRSRRDEPVNINQIEAFLVLAECLSVTETAKRMHCTQPAVTMRIRMLEQELDTVLFDRIAKRMHLTQQGMAFRDYALQVVNALGAAREHLRQMGDPMSGTIHFGASNFIGVYLVPAIIARHKQRAPKLAFELDIASSSELIRRLEANSVEFLIVSDQIELDPQRFLFRDLCRDELVLITAPCHPFAQRGEVTPTELAEETFLIKPEPSATRQFLAERMRRSGIRLGPEMHISSLEAIKQGVMHGLGVSIVSRMAVAQDIAGGLLAEVPVAGAAFERGIRIVHQRGKLLSPATARFLDLLVSEPLPGRFAALRYDQSATSRSGVKAPRL